MEANELKANQLEWSDYAPAIILNHRQPLLGIVIP